MNVDPIRCGCHSPAVVLYDGHAFCSICINAWEFQDEPALVYMRLSGQRIPLVPGRLIGERPKYRMAA